MNYYFLVTQDTGDSYRRHNFKSESYLETFYLVFTSSAVNIFINVFKFFRTTDTILPSKFLVSTSRQRFPLQKRSTSSCFRFDLKVPFFR